MMQWSLIFLGGGLGSLTRFAISKYVSYHHPNMYPIGTFITNILSCFLLGIVLQKYLQYQWSASIKSLIIVGFCGGMSTFSTFAWEMYEFAQKDQMWIGLGYCCISVIAGLLMVVIGMKTVY